MVKVEGLTDGEVVRREKESLLLEITEKVLGMTSQKVTMSSAGSIHLSPYSQASGSPVVINPDINQISVESPPYFDQAMNLAKAYEAAIPDTEFTVKLLYKRTKDLER